MGENWRMGVVSEGEVMLCDIDDVANRVVHSSKGFRLDKNLSKLPHKSPRNRGSMPPKCFT